MIPYFKIMFVFVVFSKDTFKTEGTKTFTILIYRIRAILCERKSDYRAKSDISYLFWLLTFAQRTSLLSVIRTTAMFRFTRNTYDINVPPNARNAITALIGIEIILFYEYYYTSR